MKIKYDFITNSSTTSFVLIGYLFEQEPKIDIQYKDELYEAGFRMHYGEEDGLEKASQVAIGLRFDIYDDDPCTSIVNLDDVKADLAQLEKLYPEIVKDKEIQLITGIRMS